ncbi:SDR family NAD(P)-dependent oxidoreductase [Streptomyces sp. NPDC127172]|uniref:SDR family NAD(P)-dependent oxidoreductase n=1 Tax=Streptomyces sp. NPDC127172 TaxID=3345382 RepID=UPI0036370088
MQTSVPNVSAEPLAELNSLSGRRAVVTGGAQGLGRAIADRLVEAGARVHVADLDEKLAQSAAEELGADRAQAVRLDVTDADSVSAAADLAVNELGGLDIWVNNAGVVPSTAALDIIREFDSHVPGS